MIICFYLRTYHNLNEESDTLLSERVDVYPLQLQVITFIEYYPEFAKQKSGYKYYEKVADGGWWHAVIMNMTCSIFILGTCLLCCTIYNLFITFFLISCFSNTFIITLIFKKLFCYLWKFIVDFIHKKISKFKKSSKIFMNIVLWKWRQYMQYHGCKVWAANTSGCGGALLGAVKGPCLHMQPQPHSADTMPLQKTCYTTLRNCTFTHDPLFIYVPRLSHLGTTFDHPTLTTI